jgi:hypothetical protein
MLPFTIRTAHTTCAAALKTTTHPKTRCRKPHAATQNLMLLMMGVCTRNMSSKEYINKITFLHQVGISNYFMRKMYGQRALKFFASCFPSENLFTFLFSPICVTFPAHITPTDLVIPIIFGEAYQY